MATTSSVNGHTHNIPTKGKLTGPGGSDKHRHGIMRNSAGKVARILSHGSGASRHIHGVS